MKKLLLLPLFILLFHTLTTGQSGANSWQEFISKGQYTKAIQLLSSKEDTLTQGNLMTLAFCHQKLGHLPQAKKYYLQLLEKTPESQELLMSLAGISDREFNVSQSLLYYQKLVALDTTNHFYLKEVARNLVKQRKIEEGIALLQKAIKLDSSDIDALADISNLLLNETHDNQAIIYIKKGIALDSNSIKMRQLRARYSYRNFDYERVRKDLKYTLSKGDSTVLYQRLLATSYFYLDSLAQSIFLFNRLIERGDDNELVRAGLGYALLATTDQNMIIKGTNNMFTAIKLGTSDKISDYRLAIADANVRLKEYNWAAKDYKYIIDTYQRPKAIFKLAELQEKYLKDTELSKIYYQEYARTCQLEKNKKNIDCVNLNVALQKLNLAPVPKIYAQDMKGVKADSLRIDTSDSLQVEDH
ncbi:tetratricopeptide repeat protein [Flectobacillus longus]|uniref:tetratricopeptide repeat protein n=1 Tax=Flectobacillus longus TaxID=2984207 RepID=UPI0024B69054|nr:hypothetical protein [Flectobacillus longus]MDI9879868.1 hypothetical protein [Flectobacillus longus]